MSEPEPVAGAGAGQDWTGSTTLMDRMPNVAVSSSSGGGGMAKSTQYQTFFSWQKIIKNG